MEFSRSQGQQQKFKLDHYQSLDSAASKPPRGSAAKAPGLARLVRLAA
jgi:hypothetical protein